MEYPSKRGHVLSVKIRVKKDLLKDRIDLLQEVAQDVAKYRGWVIVRFNTEKKPGHYFGWAIVEKAVEEPKHADIREAKAIVKILKKHLW